MLRTNSRKKSPSGSPTLKPAAAPRGRQRAEEELDLEKLAQAIRVKRGSRSFVAAAEEIGGVSASVLTTLENRSVFPELVTYIRVCRWLDLPMEFFVIQ